MNRQLFIRNYIHFLVGIIFYLLSPHKIVVGLGYIVLTPIIIYLYWKKGDDVKGIYMYAVAAGIAIIINTPEAYTAFLLMGIVDPLNEIVGRTTEPLFMMPKTSKYNGNPLLFTTPLATLILYLITADPLKSIIVASAAVLAEFYIRGHKDNLGIFLLSLALLYLI